jgi:hypothetical protein
MIHKKLLQFQQKQLVLHKTGENPHFKSKYVPLNEVLETVVPALNDLGVLVLQAPAENGLNTTLYDTEDDTSVTSFIPYVEATTAQKLGSNNTYNRRYALVTMLGLGDEDDDGNKASEPIQVRPEIPKVDLPDGSHTITVLDVYNGKSKTTGNPYQRIGTADGSAFNNDKNGTSLEIGETYDVIVSKGGIVQATKAENWDISQVGF